MRIGIFGTGNVGNSIGTKLVSLGHEVCLGSRTPDNHKGAAFVSDNGERASQGTFADAAEHGELVFNCVKGEHAMRVLEAAGADHLRGKVLVDLTNPLDFSAGMPPRLSVSNDDSLGEQIQAAYPETQVVKTLNTVNADIMVDPSRVGGGDHSIFVCGDDQKAKAKVVGILTDDFGWTDVIDLGGIAQARGLEMYLPLWVRLWSALGTAEFNLKIVR